MEVRVVELAATGSSADGYVLIVVLAIFWGGAIFWGRSSKTVSAVDVDRGQVVVKLLGPSRLLALRKEVVFPLESVVRVESTPNVFAKGGTFSRKIGTFVIPTFFRVGSFRGSRGQGASFWACFTGEKAVTFQLYGHRYQYVVLDVADPEETVALVKSRGGNAL